MKHPHIQESEPTMRNPKMLEIAKTDKGTSIYLKSAVPGGYYYLADGKEYTIIYNEMIPANGGRWILAETKNNGWYSDPFFTKREAIDALIFTLNALKV